MKPIVESDCFSRRSARRSRFGGSSLKTARKRWVEMTPRKLPVAAAPKRKLLFPLNRSSGVTPSTHVFGPARPLTPGCIAAIKFSISHCFAESSPASISSKDSAATAPCSISVLCRIRETRESSSVLICASVKPSFPACTATAGGSATTFNTCSRVRAIHGIFAVRLGAEIFISSEAMRTVIPSRLASTARRFSMMKRLLSPTGVQVILRRLAHASAWSRQHASAFLLA